MTKKKTCSCALVNSHLPSCPYKNQVIGWEIDFSALGEMLKEMERRVLKENAHPEGRKTRIFVAPVVKKRKKKKKAA